MNLRASWVSQTGQTREDTRLTQTGATTPVNPLQARSGILPGSYGGQHRVAGFWLEGTAAMAATLHNGRAVIQGLNSQGVYPVTLDESVVLTFADGDAQAGRIDLVCLRIHDGSYDTSGKYEAAIEVIQGTPSATPVAPTPPPLSLSLYTVAVPAGTSAGKGGITWDGALTDLRVSTVAIGGILPVHGEIIPGAYPGQYQDSGGAFQRWDGAAWVPYPAALGGIAPKGSVTTASYVGQYRDAAPGRLERWDGTAWRGAVPGTVFAQSMDAGSTVSTTYTETLMETGTAKLTATFIGPPSGSVLITIGARILAGTNATAYTSTRVTQGTTVLWEPDDGRAALVAGTGAHTTPMAVHRLGSLTAGATYTVTAMHRTSNAAAKAWFDNITIRVDPMF